MPKPPKPRTASHDAGLRSIAWAAGAAVLMVACCAVPVLIATGVAAGVLGALGVWVSNPWVIGAAVVLMLLAAAGLIRRLTWHARHPSSDPGGSSGHDCCAPSVDQPTHTATSRDED